MWEWWCRRETRTLVHGDAHAWNFLFPRVAGDDAAGDADAPVAGVYLIDWQNWQAGPPTFDLATFMVLDWYPERRAGLEATLLRRYHHRLQALGVRAYSWETCWRDYQLAGRLSREIR